MIKRIRSKEADFLGLSQDILKRGKSIRFQARGWSMRPFIQDGDFITVSPAENSSLKTGDVVFYSTTGNRLIVHRIIRKHKKNDRTTILVKGDASFDSPERITGQHVLGKVTAIERNGRKVSLDTKSNQIKGLFFAGISPFNRGIYSIGSIVKRVGRRLIGGILEKRQNPEPSHTEE